jgi:hypothetical protein
LCFKGKHFHSKREENEKVRQNQTKARPKASIANNKPSTSSIQDTWYFDLSSKDLRQFSPFTGATNMAALGLAALTAVGLPYAYYLPSWQLTPGGLYGTLTASHLNLSMAACRDLSPGYFFFKSSWNPLCPHISCTLQT